MMAFAGRSLLALRRTTQLQVLRNRKCISIRNKSGTAETDPLMMRRKVLIAIDDAPHSRKMLDIAFKHAIHPGKDEIHLCTVLHPTSPATFPMAPVASAAALTVIQHGIEVQRQADERTAQSLLQQALEHLVSHFKVQREGVYMHLLPALGGASAVSESILAQARASRASLIVVGSRGMGSIQRALMPLVGLGSVSDAVLRGAPCPVLLVRSNGTATTGPPPKAAEARAAAVAAEMTGGKRILVGYDDSEISQAALHWSISNLLQPEDKLHIATVTSPVPFPYLDEPSAAAAMAAQQINREVEEANRLAQEHTEAATAIAVRQGVPQSQITQTILQPQGGSSEAGAAIAQYAKESAIDVVVVGSRGMGAVKRSLMSFIGLGSVSDYLAHNIHCLLAVVHAPDKAAEPAGPEASAAVPATSSSE